MSLLSVPITGELETALHRLLRAGVAPNKAEIMRTALRRLAEEEAVAAVLRAEREPTLRGDLRTLVKKLVV
jgi:Arc/MetJ-type ribon-helix-helix transcriptional regulator